MPENTPSILLLSGPIGAGKTTIAQELIKAATLPTVYIEGDKFWFFIVKGDKSIGRHKNFRTIMASMLAASVPYATNGYEVILDFSIPPWFLDTARKIAGMRGVPLEYVVLRPSEAVCAARAASRAEGVIDNYADYHDLYLSFDEAPKYILCDDVGNATQVAEAINKERKTGKFLV